MHQLPQIPPKKVFGRTSEKTINRRKMELQVLIFLFCLDDVKKKMQSYIEQLMAIPDVACCEQVLNFLEASSNV